MLGASLLSRFPAPDLAGRPAQHPRCCLRNGRSPGACGIGPTSHVAGARCTSRLAAWPSGLELGDKLQ
eukprot:1030181-Alexandrium_andersonii.AAC.1